MRQTLRVAVIAATTLTIWHPGYAAASRFQQPAPTLIGPVYPTSVPVPYESEAREHRDGWRFKDANRVFTESTRSFYSKERLETVRAYYSTEAGEMQNGSLEYLRVPEGMRSESMAQGPYVYSTVIDRADSELLGVQIRSIAPRKERPHNLPAVGAFYQKLVTAQAAGHGTLADVDRIMEEHEHLAWLFYPLTDERSADGDRLTADQVVLRHCEAEQGGGMSQEELSAKMEAAAQQGDIAELQRLSQSAMGTVGGGSMDAWVECLGELEQHGYTTLITIDVRPSAGS